MRFLSFFLSDSTRSRSVALEFSLTIRRSFPLDIFLTLLVFLSGSVSLPFLLVSLCVARFPFSQVGALRRVCTGFRARRFRRARVRAAVRVRRTRAGRTVGRAPVVWYAFL